jgi:hypothetical protein
VEYLPPLAGRLEITDGVLDGPCEKLCQKGITELTSPEASRVISVLQQIRRGETDLGEVRELESP